MNEGSRCPFCAHATGLEVRLDKRGRPYVQCGSCLTRAFLRSRKALAGVLGLGAVIDEVPTLSEDVFERGERAVEAWLGANQAVAVAAAATNSHPEAEAGGSTALASGRGRSK